MLKNYLKIALRNVRRSPAYAFINITGLAVGMAACLAIGLFVQFKLSYDRHLPMADRVYRLILTGLTTPDGTPRPDVARLQPGVAAAARQEIPEIEAMTHIIRNARSLFRIDEERFFIEQLFTVDEYFFDVFPYRLLQGDPATAFVSPGRLVLTQSEAQRLFGDENPVGKTITYENAVDYTITGVIEDPPAHTHFRFDALRSLSEEQRKGYVEEINWSPYAPYVYMLLPENTDPATVAAKVNAFREQNAPAWFNESGVAYALEPLPRIHLHSNVGSDLGDQSDIRYLYFFSAIGVLILLIAAFNYMNLSTARAASRAAEVGIRQVVGASRAQLIRQFLSESILMTALAVPIALLLVDLIMPLLNQWIGQEIRFDYLGRGLLLPAMIGVLLATGLGAGSYPALFLSRFRPAHVLYGRSGIAGGARLRKTLVVLQFAASLGLVLATLVVQHQLDYVQQRGLGFDQDLVVTLDREPVSDQYEAFKTSLLQASQVAFVSSGIPLGIGWADWVFSITDPETRQVWELYGMGVDYGFVETMGLTLLEGRDFSIDHPSDVEHAVLLNRSAAERFGIAADPIGQAIWVHEKEKTVAGIVDDFHYASLHEPIRPLLIDLEPRYQWTVLVRLQPGPLQESLAALESIWSAFVPDRPFEPEFLDERIEQQYQAEQRLARIFGLFSGLAILIACLGLFGLTAFTAASRTKEIGIRKVLGADVSSIVLLLSRDFLLLVLLAAAVAVPLGWWAMRVWIDRFAYHIQTPWLTFGLLVGIALLLALLIVSYQAIKAALADPVKALQYE